MGVQMIQPGETAWAHRHSIAALRFVIQGHPSLTTVVDGEPCVMEDFDLVLTPNWSWHDHHNRSDKPVYWLDVLDVPLVLGLNQTFYEAFGEKEQTAGSRGPDAPVLRFPWRDVEQKLKQQAAQKGNLPEGAVYDYINPATGGATLPTLLCRAQWLPAGFETRTVRRTSSAVYFVVRGEGKTEIDGQEIGWGKNDCFVVPNWARHRHVNLSKNGEAVLFSVHDTPVLKALGLYREDAAGTQA
jgi:1-hydroxy-2-naphthoate dioxygenase